MRISKGKETDPSRIVQSKGGLRREFKFDDDHLVYKIKSKAFDTEFKVAYETINLMQRSKRTIHRSVYSARLDVLAGVILISSIFAAQTNPPVAVAMVASAVCLALANYVGRRMTWVSVTVTLFHLQPPPPGTSEPLAVIHDRHYDRVMGLLEGRWRARIKALHGDADLHADPRSEAARLARLRELDIIDETHLRDQLDRLDIVQVERKPVRRSVN